MVDDLVPEIGRDIVIIFFSGHFVFTRRADDLGDLGVNMQALELIPLRRQRVEKNLVVKAAGQGKIIGVSGDRIQVGQDLGHAAMLNPQHFLNGLVIKLIKAHRDPGGHLLGDVERLFVSAIEMHVKKAGHDFVQRVPGCPDTLPFDHPVDELLRISAQVAAFSEGLLAPGEFGDKGIGFPAERYVPGARIGEGTTRKIVADEMAAQFDLRLFPASERLRR